MFKRRTAKILLLMTEALRLLSLRLDLQMSRSDEAYRIARQAAPLSSTIKLSQDLSLLRQENGELKVTLDMLMEKMGVKVIRDEDQNYLLVSR